MSNGTGPFTKSDGTTCVMCGGDFNPPVVIDGLSFHSRCAIMSHGPHTHADYSRLMSKLWAVWEAAMKFEYDLSADCDGHERNVLRKVLAETYRPEVLEAHRAKLNS